MLGWLALWKWAGSVSILTFNHGIAHPWKLDRFFFFVQAPCNQNKVFNKQGVLTLEMGWPLSDQATNIDEIKNKDANKARSNCAIIGYNLSKKHKLTQYKTQNGESNYVDHKFFFNFYQELPPVQSLGVRHPNTIELPSWLVHVLCGFKATWHHKAYFSSL